MRDPRDWPNVVLGGERASVLPYVRAEGPFADAAAAQSNAAILTAALDAVDVDRYPVLRFYVERGLRSTCQTLASLGEACAT